MNMVTSPAELDRWASAVVAQHALRVEQADRQRKLFHRAVSTVDRLAFVTRGPHAEAAYQWALRFLRLSGGAS
jgi:fructoselysine-6-P-deglycase FrlB-like protein